MNKVINTMAVVLMPMSVVLSQTIGTPGQSPERIREISRKNTERLTKELMLSEQQIVEVSKINDEAAEDMIRLNEERQKAIREREEKLRQVLTEDQYKKLNQDRSTKREKIRERRGRKQNN